MLKTLVTFYIIVEIISIFLFINNLDFLTYLAEVIVSFFIGIFILIKCNLRNYNLSNNFNITNYSLVLISGILLIIPGILSDVIGICLLLFSGFLKLTHKNTNSNTYKNTYDNTNNKKNDEENIIDVEIIKED